MAGTRPLRSDDFGALVLAAVLVLSVVAGTASIGAAHEENDHVERNGGTLQIELGNEHFDGPERNVTVQVEDGNSETLAPSQTNNGRSIYRIGVQKLSATQRDLGNVTVTVTPVNGTSVTERENLQVLKFGESSQVTFENDQRLHVPLKKALGYADGTEVTVELDGESEAVSGTVQYVDQNPFLAVSFDPGKLSLPLSEQATIGVPDRGESTNVALRTAVKTATEVVAVGGESVVVTNPLLASGTNYDLSIRTTQPDGRFARTKQTNGTGALVVSDAALAAAGDFTVSVYQNGNPLFEGYSHSPGTEKPVEATVGPNGTAVTFDGPPFSAENVTVWLANETRYVSVDATVTNGTAELRSSDYRLHPNGSYRLVVTGEQFARANVTGNGNGTNGTNTLFYSLPPGNVAGSESGDETAPNGSDDSSNGVLGDMDLKLVGAVALVFVGLALVGIVGVLKFRSRGPSPTGASGTAVSGRDDPKVTVMVEDGGTNSRFDDDVTVTAQKHGTTGTEKQTTVTNGRGTIPLDHGRWYVTAESNGVSEKKRVRVTDDTAVTFTLGPQQAQVKVSDDDGEPLSNVEVTCSPDAGPSKTRAPDSQGRVTVGVPFSASEVELSADHEKYEGDATTVSFDGDATARASLALRRLTGDLRVTATIDGASVPGVRVEATPREKSMRELGEQKRTATTDDSGVVTFDGLLVGEYEIGMAVPGGRDVFATESRRVRVRDGTVARESLDAAFEYSLGRDDRDRIAAIRRDAESLASASGRDVAIPRYYGTVVTDLLDAVERVPSEGHRFVTVDADPSEVVAALLDAAEETVGLINDAMTTKRNTDLFGACVDMPDQRVEWTGRFDPDTLFELLAEDRKTQRQTVLQQLRSVDDRINDERSGLAVVAPTRELWERVQEFVTSERGEDPVRGAAVAFVADGLLDAVDELFDHEELRDRLERTVF